MQPVYIIDGYNMLHAVPELRRLLEQDLETARKRLESYLQRYLGIKKVKITLVYDGQWQSSQLGAPARGLLQVLFSKSPQTADDLIKKLIEKHTPAKNITVITRDADIVNFAKARRVRVIEPFNFFNMLYHRQTHESFQQKKYQNDMTPEELDEWLTIFGENSGESKKNSGKKT